LDRIKYKALSVKAQKHVIADGRLYWRDLVGILLLCLTEGENLEVVNEYHGCLYGGHYSWNYSGKVTTQNLEG